MITLTQILFPMVFLFMSYASLQKEAVTLRSCFAMFAFVFTSSTFGISHHSDSSSQRISTSCWFPRASSAPWPIASLSYALAFTLFSTPVVLR